MVEDTTANEPLGLGYKEAIRHALESAKDLRPSLFELRQCFRSVPDQQRGDETPMPRLPTYPTWVDPEDSIVYMDIDFDGPPVHVPVQTPASPDWSFGSLPVSPASLTVPSPVASPVTTLAATIAVDEYEFIEGMGRHITELYDRSAVVIGEIHSQRFRLGRLEQRQEQATITFGALWRVVLALEAWAGQTDV
ncbi:hypothetical protein Tco_1104832 [Tanacetum coccineum]